MLRAIFQRVGGLKNEIKINTHKSCRVQSTWYSGAKISHSSWLFSVSLVNSFFFSLTRYIIFAYVYKLLMINYFGPSDRSFVIRDTNFILTAHRPCIRVPPKVLVLASITLTICRHLPNNYYFHLMYANDCDIILIIYCIHLHWNIADYNNTLT